MNTTKVLPMLIVSLLLWLAGPTVAQQVPPIDLAGQWRFAIDEGDIGVNQSWWRNDLSNRINIPGILQSQGYGNEISTETPWVAALPRDMRWFLLPQYEAYTRPGNIKVPYLSQPPRHYLGAAWYQRDIDIPPAWQGKRVHLMMERPRWETRVWIDDKPVGSNNSLCAPHEYDLGVLSPGRHRLTVRCDNRPNIVPGYRPDGHSVSDALGSSWNGIAGRVELTATSPVWIEDVQVFPSISRWTARVRVQIGNLTGQSGAGTVVIGEHSEPVQWSAAGGQREIEIRLPQGAKMWDEFNPEVQKLTVQLTGDGADDQRTVSYGIREIWTDGPNFLLNGKVINLRGTHWGGDFPLTGYPATDVESWKKVLQICRDYGLNHIRFHSWCPPEAAFTAADELGIYLQPEAGMWNPFNPMDPMSKMLELETARIMKAYGNHPSFVMFSASNETSGNWQDVLNSWAYRWYRQDQRHVYSTNIGRSSQRDWGAQYASTPYRSTGGWFGRDYGSQLQNRIPDVAHEVGQWCAYPDFDIIKNLSGYLQPKNYEIFRDSAAAHGVLERNKEFTYNSGKFQVACYKEEIEANLRTPGAAGFQLLDLHDYVGQGGALVGILDPLWQSKGYITPEEFRRFCNTTVPLARVTNLTPTTSDTFAVPVEIAHFGPEPLAQARPVWKIVDSSGKVAIQGQFEPKDIPIGKNIELGTVNVDLSTLPAPMQYKLVVGLEGTQFENDWNFWLYPAAPSTDAPADILVTGDWNAAQGALASGGKVLFTPRISSLDDTSPPLNNVPVFWNRLMNPGLQSMMGLLIHPEHPALALFPSQTWCDWNWTAAIRNGVPPTGGGRGRGGFGGGFAQAAPAADEPPVPPGSPPAAARGGQRGGARGALGGQRGGRRGGAAFGPATNPTARRGGRGGRGGAGGAPPPPAYIRAINVEKLPKGLEPIVSAIDDWNRNYRLAVVFEVKVGNGRLIVCAPDVQNDLDQRVVPRQLRVSLLDYMKSDTFQPPVSVTADQLSALWPGREGFVAPAARPQALPGDIIENPVPPPAQ